MPRRQYFLLSVSLCAAMAAQQAKAQTAAVTSAPPVAGSAAAANASAGPQGRTLSGRNPAVAAQKRSDAGAGAAPTGQDTGAASTAAIEQVVVTGQNRAQKLQHVPAAITAFTDQRRNLIGVETGRDIANLTPSVSLQGEYFTIRGLGRFEDPGQGIDPGAAIYVDGVYTSSPAYLNQPDFLTDRIEVLRGPQSVYGRNAIAGAADLYSVRPTDAWHGDFRVGGTSLADGYTDDSLSGPITNNLRGRFAYAFSGTADGPQDNLARGYPGSSTGTTRLYEGQVDWTPTDDLDVWTRYQGFSENVRGAYGAQTGLGTGTNQLSPYFTGTPTLASYTAGANSFYGLAPNPQFGLAGNLNPALTNRYNISIDDPGNINLKSDNTFTTNITQDLHWATLKYIGGFSEYDYEDSLDADGTSRAFLTSPLGVQTPSAYVDTSFQHKEWYSNEIILTSPNDQKLRWVAGVYQYAERYHTNYQVDIPDEASLADPVFSATGAPAPYNPTRAFYNQNTNLRTESQAAYGRLDYDVAPTVTLTGDMRYNWDQKYGGNNFREIYDLVGFYGPYVSQHGLDVTPAIHDVNASRDFRDWSGKIQADWHPNASTTAYAEIAKGYKPGGFDLGAFSSIPILNSETLTDYEAGVKKTFGTTLVVDAAAYYYAYHNLQAPITVGLPVANPVTGVTSTLFAGSAANARSSYATGFELESTYSPLDDLHFTFIYSLQDAEFTNFTSQTVGAVIHDPVSGLTFTNLRGNQLPQAPRNKLSFIPQYVFPVGPGNLSVSATLTWTDKQYFGVFDVPGYLGPSSYNLDLRALYQPERSHWTVIGYIRNVGNSLQYIYYGPGAQPGPFPATQTLYTLSEPRTFGAELQYKF